MVSFKENVQALALAGLVACNGDTRTAMYWFCALGAVCFGIYIARSFIGR